MQAIIKGKVISGRLAYVLISKGLAVEADPNGERKTEKKKPGRKKKLN